jgi:hypothetical protein
MIQMLQKFLTAVQLFQTLHELRQRGHRISNLSSKGNSGLHGKDTELTHTSTLPTSSTWLIVVTSGKGAKPGPRDLMVRSKFTTDVEVLWMNVMDLRRLKEENLMTT